MSPSYDSGVADYKFGIATVIAPFPVDRRGNVHACCDQCKFYYGRRCALTGEISAFPSTHRGDQCPLIFEEEGANDG